MAGWWSIARLPELLAAYVGLEADATLVRAVALELVPGLLQTKDYAREVHRLAVHTVPPDEIDRLVSARMRRQHRLTDPQPLKFSAVVSEAALRRCAGGHLIDESVIVGRLDRIFAALRRQALSTEESVALLSELLATATRSAERGIMNDDNQTHSV